MIIISLSVLFILIEGIGGIIPREYIYYLYFILPTVFFFYLKAKKKPIFFPHNFSIIYGFFLFFSFISVLFFSVDKQVSFELTVFYFSAFLIFIFFYNNKELAKRYIRTAVFMGSIIFSAVYLFKLSMNPVDGYQLVIPYFNNVHNHLGDFLGLGLTISVYFLIFKKEKNWFLGSILFLPLFFLSFSRTAYVSLLVTLIFLLIRNKLIRLFSFKAGVVLVLVILSTVFFFSTVKEVNNKTIVGRFNQVLSARFNLQNKTFTAERLVYLKQGIASFIDHPLFGVGPGNFNYLSKKYQSQQSQWYQFETVDNAHSLSLDILFENGGLAFIFFGIFTIFLLINIFKKNNLENYLLLYLLINFQTDYTYKIYSVFILFMILAATVYEEKEVKINGFQIYYLSGIALSAILIAIISSQILLKFSFPILASVVYPLNKDAYKKVVSDKARYNSCQAAKKEASWLYSISRGYLPTLDFLSFYYEGCGDKKLAVILLDEASFSNKFISFDIVKKDYLLKKEVYGGKIASDYLKKVLRNYDHLKYDESFQKQVVDFCLKNGERACKEQDFGGFKYFYEPDPKNHEKILKQVPYPESYSINKDTLNEHFDYLIPKPIDTFRIIILGDSSTFGLLVKTKDNWTERLEDRLNQNLKNQKIKKIEVINLAVHGYDIPYEVERFRRRGLKYKPDLVLWLIDNSNFYQFNEVMIEKVRRIEEQMKKTGELEKEISKGNYYSAWEKAMEETKKEIGSSGFFTIIKSYLNSFQQDYSGPLVIVGPSFSDKNKKLLRETFGEKKAYFDSIDNFYEQKYKFLGSGQINELGHQMISNEVFRFINEYKLIRL